MTLKSEIAASVDKVTRFALDELNRWQSSQSELLSFNAANGKALYIKDWQIKTHSPDTVTCIKRQLDPIIFHSKTCAIIYVVNDLRGHIMNTIKIQELDEQIYRFRIKLDILRMKMHRQRKNGYTDKFMMLQDRYSDTAVKLNNTIAKIKKYCNLTKYNKGILL
jgi:hypothetical protein